MSWIGWCASLPAGLRSQWRIKACQWIARGGRGEIWTINCCPSWLSSRLNHGKTLESWVLWPLSESAYHHFRRSSNLASHQRSSLVRLSLGSDFYLILCWPRSYLSSSGRPTVLSCQLHRFLGRKCPWARDRSYRLSCWSSWLASFIDLGLYP